MPGILERWNLCGGIARVISEEILEGNLRKSLGKKRCENFEKLQEEFRNKYLEDYLKLVLKES